MTPVSSGKLDNIPSRFISNLKDHIIHLDMKRHSNNVSTAMLHVIRNAHIITLGLPARMSF